MKKLIRCSLVLTLFVVTGCTSKDTKDSKSNPISKLPKDALITDVSGTPGGHIVFAMAGEPKTFNPITSTDVSSSTMLSHVFPALIGLDYDSMETQMELAKSMDISWDNLRYTFKIRRGIQWSDGHPFTVDDVMFTYKVITDKNTIAGAQDVLKQADGSYPKLVQVDDETVQFVLSSVNALFYSVVSNLYILPKHALEEEFKAGNFMSSLLLNADPKSIPVLGPYKIEKYVPAQRVTFSRNPHYWKFDKKGQRLPYLDKVIRVIVPDLNAMSLKFQNGEVDILEIRPEDFDLMNSQSKTGDFTVTDLGAGLATYFFDLNLSPGKNSKGVHFVDPEKSKIFYEKKFRQALSYAMDRKGIIKTVFHGRATPIASFSSPANKLWSNPKPKSYPYDLKTANRLLDEIGLVDVDGDGIRELPSGKPFKFTIKTNTERAARVSIGNILKQDFRKIGLDVNLNPVPFNNLITALDSTRDYEAVILGWGSGVPPDPVMSKNVILSSGRVHNWNPAQKTPATPWEAKMDALMLKNQGTTKLKERQKYWRELLEIWEEQLPQIMILSPNLYVGVKNKFGNVSPSVMRPYFEWNLEEIYDRSRK